MNLGVTDDDFNFASTRVKANLVGDDGRTAIREKEVLREVFDGFANVARHRALDHLKVMTSRVYLVGDFLTGPLRERRVEMIDCNFFAIREIEATKMIFSDPEFDRF